MKRLFLMGLVAGWILLVGLRLVPAVIAQCRFDHYGDCIGSCSCPAGKVGSCVCSDASGMCEVDTSGCTQPTSTPRPTSIENPNPTSGSQPTDYPTPLPGTPAINQDACGGSGLHCNNGFYCCQNRDGSAACCPIGSVDPTNSGGGGGSSPTNTPTPTPGPWVKLKSTSFYSSGSLVNHIPLVPAAYDSEDDGSPYFIISGSGRASGLTAGQSIHIDGLNANAKVNVNDWSLSGYTSGWKMTPSSFGGYVKG